MQMFKEIILKFSCLLIIITTAGSCKKYLDLKPEDGIIRQNFWKTKEQVQAAVNGCYASLLGPDPTTELLFLWGELRADLLAPSTGISGQELDVMNVNTVSYTHLRAHETPEH